MPQQKEIKEKQFGFRVRIKFKQNSPFAGGEEIYRNVTEIHYCYTGLVRILTDKRVAFESDIQGTGITQPIDYIEEFEAILETKKQKTF